ncbi:hypothetical protein LMG28614_04797 [Paraburkholderia ultramafica]|uniref:Uncharacterized protein n=2 Tax=Paraburkholderia ultramafica TaxID=1544867 RepID=A0A6S7BT72_9BURK|nr:hypothetical protein LMG28614_04797 [Paraburkholderia ultramafica]
MSLPVGIAALIWLVVHEGFGDLMRVIGQAGFVLLWLVPFHALPLLLDAHAWRLLLRKQASLPFLWWVATVREAVSRLLPVASIGGEIVGIRLARWRVLDTSFVSASVIVEVLVTITVQYAFSALGLVLIVATTHDTNGWRAIGLSLLLSLPLLLFGVALVRRGGIFHVIESWAGRVLGDAHPLLQGINGKRLDQEIDALMRCSGLLLRAFSYQLGGYVLGAAEVYWALAWLGHPVSVSGSVAIEALIQALRHAAFFVPAGIGIQEFAVVMLAQIFGVDRETALSMALVKRMREVVFGVFALASWQLVELIRGSTQIQHAIPPANAAHRKRLAPAVIDGD